MTRDTILVVDDAPQNLLVARGHLEAAGYQVATASSGERALEYLADRDVELVVLDVLMPGLGGFETCRRIRATPRIADTPILFLTALGDREVTGPALEAGADDVLAKPFNRSELVLRVRALIRQHQRQRRTTAIQALLAELDPVAMRLVDEARARGDLSGDLASLEKVVVALRAVMR